MQTRVIAATAVSALVAAVPLAVWAAQDKPAAPESYTVDAVHSSVVFKISHLGITNFYGAFEDIEGEFTLDEGDPAACAFDFRVPVASLHTRNTERDKHLASKDFFNVERFKYVAFKSTKVERKDKTTYALTGDLTLLGVTKPINVQLERIGAGVDPWGKHRTGFEARFSVKRSDFGMKTALDTLGDEVELIVAVEGVRK